MKKLFIIALLFMMFVTQPKTVPKGESVIDFTPSWSVINIVGTVYSMTGAILDTELEGVSTITLQIENLGYNYQTVSTYDSELKLYDGAVLVLSVDMEDLLTDDFDGTIVIDLDNWIVEGRNDYVIPDNDGLYEIDYVGFNVMQTFTSVPTDYESDWEDVNTITMVRDYFTIKYYHIDSGTVTLYETQQVYSIFPETITDPDDLSTTNIFEYWAYRTSTGEWIKYDYSVPLSDDMYYDENNYVFMMAVYTNYIDDYVLDYSDTSNIPTNLDNILGVVGMDNQTGYIFIYGLLNIILLLAITFLGLKTLYGMILSMTISGLFVFFNILPIYITAIVLLLYIFTFKTSTVRGYEQ